MMRFGSSFSSLSRPVFFGFALAALTAASPAQTTVGTTTGTLTATVAITAPGTIGAASAINVLTQGAANKDFKYVSGGTCVPGNTYAVTSPLTTCTVLYTFTPSRPGQRLGAVSLTNSAGTAVLGTAYISGTGTGPLVYFPGPALVSLVYTGYSYLAGVAVDGYGNLYVATQLREKCPKLLPSTEFWLRTPQKLHWVHLTSLQAWPWTALVTSSLA
jgi:hypothetical protein